MTEESPQGAAEFDLPRVAFLYLLLLGCFQVISGIRESIPGLRTPSHVWAYDSALSHVIVLGIALAVRPRILTLSRWKPAWTDVAVGLLAGIAASVVPLLIVAGPAKHLSPIQPYLAVPILLLAPLGEELLFRGVFLRSLLSHHRAWIAIPIVVVMAAIGHQNFWFALWSQLVLCLVYLARHNSLAAAIICHFCANVVAFLPVASVLTKLHLHASP